MKIQETAPSAVSLFRVLRSLISAFIALAYFSFADRRRCWAAQQSQRCIGLGPPVAGDGAAPAGTLSRLGMEPGSIITISPMRPKLSFTGKESFWPERRSTVSGKLRKPGADTVIKHRPICGHPRVNRRQRLLSAVFNFQFRQFWQFRRAPSSVPPPQSTPASYSRAKLGCSRRSGSYQGPDFSRAGKMH